MDFSEYLKEAKIGDVVWICDFRYNDIDNKPIRHVRPQRVIVVDNDELPKNKRVYYSSFHFRPVSDSGKVKSQIIAPYDNTGFRAYKGVPVQVFRDRDKCVAYYNGRCHSIIGEFEHAKETKVQYYNEQITNIHNEIISKEE